MYEINEKRNECLCVRVRERGGSVGRTNKLASDEKQAKPKSATNKKNILCTNHSVHVAV